MNRSAFNNIIALLTIVTLFASSIMPVISYAEDEPENHTPHIEGKVSSESVESPAQQLVSETPIEPKYQSDMGPEYAEPLSSPIDTERPIIKNH
jgi:hypothetical protein